MKKIFKLCAMVMTCFVALFTMTACGDKAIESLEIKSGTMEYTYEKGQIVSFENLVIIVNYNDDTNVEVKYGDPGLSVSGLSTATTGTKEITISYSSKSITVEVKVINPTAGSVVKKTIDALPAADTVTLENKTAILAARNSYNELSETEKAKVTNLSKLEACEAKVAALELAAYKATKKAELAAYKTENNYSTSGWTTIQGYITTANTTIDAATNNDAIDAAVATAKTSIDAVQTKVQELSAYKTAKREELATYKVEADYNATNWSIIQGYITTANSAINQANTIAEVDTAVATAKISIDAVASLADELAAYKAAKKAELATYKVEADYSAPNWQMITAYVALYGNQIDNATSNTAIDTIVSAAKTMMDAIKTEDVTNVETLIANLPAVADVVVTDRQAVTAARTAYNALSSAKQALVTNKDKLFAVEEKLSSLLSLDELKETKKAELANYKKNNVYNPINEALVAQYKLEAEDLIDGATTVAEVNEIVAETYALIDAVKVKAITDVEDAIEALTTEVNALNKEEVKAAVSSVKAAYEALLEQKVLVNNYQKLVDVEAAIAAFELEELKTQLKVDLVSYKNEADYVEANWTMIQNIISAAETAINAATSEPEVRLLVAQAKADMDAVHVKELSEVEKAINDLPNVNDLTLENYESYEEDINYAKEKFEALNPAYQELISELEAKLNALIIRVNELVLAKSKLDAKEELSLYVKEENYSSDKWEKILELIENGNSAIDAAKTPTDVTAALSNVETSIDAIPTLTELNDEYATYSIVGWETPKNVSARNTQSNNSSEENGYVTKDRVYYVGDDNPFVFLPDITARIPLNDGTDEKKTVTGLTEFRTTSTIKLGGKDGTTLTGADLSKYVEVDDYTFSYDFTEDAIGETFEITIVPYSYPGMDNNLKQTIIIEVVEGYNVTNAKELGLMTNYDEEDGIYVNAWNIFLKNNGIEPNANLKGLVLQNNITIYDRDIPDAYFADRYLKDYTFIYGHSVQGGTTFNLYGNYFNVDASAVSNIDTTKADGGASHSSLFKIWNAACIDVDYGCTNVEETIMNIQDASFIGNASKADSTIGFGGLTLFKLCGLTSNLTNTISRSFYINIFGDAAGSVTAYVNVTNSKSYDAFQNIVFLFGGAKLNVKNSVFQRCGGPAIIAQHYKADKDTPPTTLRIPEITKDEVSVIESYVTGQENWFAYFGATEMATKITALDELFLDYSNGFINKNGKMNIVNLLMTDGYGISSGTFTQGSFVQKVERVDEDPETTVIASLMSGKTIVEHDQEFIPMEVEGGTINVSIKDVYGMGAIVFETDTGAVGIYTGEDYIVPLLSNKGTAQYDHSKGEFATAKYLTLYTSGMAITLQMNSTQPSAE